jgi:glycine/D-amino acid oxidase-like deaminating enzyme
VRATEGYTQSLTGQRRTVAPIYSLMLATEPLSDETWSQIGLANRQTFADWRNLIIYGQRTADGRIAFGGRGAPYHFASTIKPEYDRDTAVHSGLVDVLTEMFPVLAGTQITHRWGGPLGVPRDWMASVGLEGSNAWAGGYVGDGVGTTNLAGRTLADLITGKQTHLTALPWVSHRSPKWEPEPLRWIGANLGLRTMTWADSIEDRTGRPSRLGSAMYKLLGQ